MYNVLESDLGEAKQTTVGRLIYECWIDAGAVVWGGGGPISNALRQKGAIEPGRIKVPWEVG